MTIVMKFPIPNATFLLARMSHALRQQEHTEAVFKSKTRTALFSVDLNGKRTTPLKERGATQHSKSPFEDAISTSSSACTLCLQA